MGDLTRLCTDPWDYLEIRADGGVAPCCNYGSLDVGSFDSLDEVRTNETFRVLRETLLSGDLIEPCISCTIRKRVSTGELRHALINRYSHLDDLTAAPHHIEMLRIEVTERCNLRCTYCALSQSDFDHTHGRELSDELVAGTLKAVVSHGDIDEITLNGHGETTFRKGWETVCEAFARSGARLSITTNLARSLSEPEVEALSRFSLIVISIDGVDATLMKEVRRKTDVGTVLYNLARIRARAMSAGFTMPRFVFQCGLYDRSVTGLVDFAWFSVACGIDSVSFWKLKKYPDVPNVVNVYSLDTLSEEAFEEAKNAFREMRNILTEHQIGVIENGDLFERDVVFDNQCTVDVRREDCADDQQHCIRIHVVPNTPVPEQSVVMYFAGMKDGLFYPFQDGVFSAMEEGREPEPIASASWVEQTISLRLKEADAEMEMSAFYFGSGTSFNDMVASEAYFPVDVRN